MGWNPRPFLGSQINRAHPLLRGLKLCSPLNESGGLYLQDVASNLRQGTITGGIWKPMADDGVYLNGSGQYIGYPQISSDLTNTQEMTVSMCCNILNPVANDRYFETKAVYSDLNGWTIQDSGVVNFQFFCNVAQVIALQGYTTGVWAEQTISYKNPGNCNGYINGVLKAQVATTYGMSSNSNPFYIARYGSGGNNATIMVKHIFFWNRQLSDQEVMDFYNRPYAMFEQPQRAKWFMLPVAGVAQQAYQPWAQMGPILAQ